MYGYDEIAAAGEIAASVVILLVVSIVFSVLWRISWPQARQETLLTRFSLFLAYLFFLAPVITLFIVAFGMLLLETVDVALWILRTAR